ncbi:hypothetical protein ACQI4E_02650 [Streptomyces sp. CA-252508]|uniref:hypothetical protein n=1 Tax=Streptomyces sp. CA-252508 TaxID=3418946 RepID=UPI003D9042A4
MDPRTGEGGIIGPNGKAVTFWYGADCWEDRSSSAFMEDYALWRSLPFPGLRRGGNLLGAGENLSRLDRFGEGATTAEREVIDAHHRYAVLLHRIYGEFLRRGAP